MFDRKEYGKKAVGVLLCMALLAAPAISSTAYAAPADGTVATAFQAAAATATVTAPVNVRKGIGTSYPLLATLAKGATVTVLDSTSNANWAKVRTKSNIEGYCLKECLQIGAASSGSGSSGSGSSGGTVSGSVYGTAVTKDRINIRKSIGTSYPVVATADKGAKLTVLDYTSNGGWAKVRTAAGVEGYCMKEYITVTPASGGGTASGGSGTSTAPALYSAVSKERLNIRQGAGSSYPVTAIAEKGETLSVLDYTTSAGWAKVRTKSGVEGYCMKEYIQVSGSSSSGGSTQESAIPAEAKDFLNIRSGAGESYPVIQVIPAGTKITIIDNSHATWAKVRLADGTVGCCLKEYLSITPTDDSPGSSGTQGGGTPGATENPGGTGSSGGTSSGSGQKKITGAIVTGDSLRVRSQPNTSANIVTTLTKGTKVTVLDSSNTEWTKIQTASGTTGYVSKQYIQFQYEDGSSSTGKATSLTLATRTGVVPVGKTLYLKASVSPQETAISWTSSNPSVATVSNGYVLALAPGSATITAACASVPSVGCTVTVIEGEPVKTAYASPNIAGPGQTITLVAVTDATRDGVQFVVDNGNGTTQTVSASSFENEVIEGNTARVWKGTVSISSAGAHRVTVLSSKNGTYSSSGFTTNAYVASTQDFTSVTNEERRASDEIIKLIAGWEGYRASVYADALTSTGVPTVGYGYTLKDGQQFYNNLTKTEAWSLLVNTINNASYTTEINQFISSNGLLMNQNHFDALVSFGYNVGAGYWNNASAEIDLRRIMLNAVNPSGISGEVAGTVSKSAVVRDTASVAGNQVREIQKGTLVTVTGTSFTTQKDGWYAVRLEDGTTGWVISSYITLSNASSLSHDLSYTNAYAFGTDMLRWNVAGGKSYAGLLYRRLGEANVYNYNDYSAARTNTHGYTYPAALAYLDTK